MKKIELGAKYKIFMYLFASLTFILLCFIAFLASTIIFNIKIEMSQEDYYIAFGIIGFLILVCLGMPFIIFRKAFYDEENKKIVLISYFGIKRTIRVDSEDGFAIVYLTKAEDKEKCVVDLRSDGRFLLTIVVTKKDYEKEITSLDIKTIETI